MTFPNVSIVVAIKNEIRYIQRCLDALMNQDYPANYYEILIVDGMSKDGTKEYVLSMIQKFKNMRLLLNSKETYVAGLNIGIKNSIGDIIIRVDGHVIVEKDFISKNIEYLQKKNATVVGGRIITMGDKFIGKCIANVLSSPFGIGNSRFRYSSKAGYVKTLAFCAYRKDIFDKVGLFDESKDRSNDIELHARIRKIGGTIFYTPEIKSYYFCRSTITGFMKQSYKNGSGVMNALNSVSLRHITPFIFVSGIFISFLVFLFYSRALLIFLFVIYFLTAVSFSVVIAVKEGIRFLSLLPIIFFILHFSYGIGSFFGLFKLLLQKLKLFLKMNVAVREVKLKIQ